MNKIKKFNISILIFTNLIYIINTFLLLFMTILKIYIY